MWVLIGLGACSGDADDPSTSDARSAEWRVEVRDVLDAPFVGASVCAADCVETGADGFATVELPAERTLVEITAADHLGDLYALDASTADPEDGLVVLIPSSLIEVTIAGATNSWDAAATGLVSFAALSDGDAGIAGVGVALDPPAGDGPWMLDATGLSLVDDAQTTAAGGGLIVGVPPGLYTLMFTGLPAGCDVVVGWDDGEGVVAFEVRAGLSSWIELRCS